MKRLLFAAFFAHQLLGQAAFAGGKTPCATPCAPLPRTLCGYEQRCIPQVTFIETACTCGPLPKYEYCLPKCNPCRDNKRFWDYCPDHWHNLLPNR